MKPITSKSTPWPKKTNDNLYIDLSWYRYSRSSFLLSMTILTTPLHIKDEILMHFYFKSWY